MKTLIKQEMETVFGGTSCVCQNAHGQTIPTCFDGRYDGMAMCREHCCIDSHGARWSYSGGAFNSC